MRSLDATLPVYNLRTLADQMNGSLFAQRLAATLLTAFGLLALSLAAVGIYGVLSYSVTARTREMGIRLAQGAQREDILRLIVGEGMSVALIGVGIGLAACWGLSRLMERLLFGVSATDPATFMLTALLLTTVAFVACWMPARRATRLDPLIALRSE